MCVASYRQHNRACPHTVWCEDVEQGSGRCRDGSADGKDLAARLSSAKQSTEYFLKYDNAGWNRRLGHDGKMSAFRRQFYRNNQPQQRLSVRGADDTTLTRDFERLQCQLNGSSAYPHTCQIETPHRDELPSS